MRPVLLGMNNPHSDDPRYALWPAPRGCTGWRTWRLSGLTREVYLEAFDRRNLVNSRRWDRSAAKKAGAEMVGRLEPGSRVVVLGAETWVALGIGPRPPVFRSRPVSGSEFWFAPHPSGRCRFYNIPKNRRGVRTLLQGLVDVRDTGGLR